MERSSGQTGVLRYGDETIPYSISFDPKRSQRIKIDVLSDGGVNVDAPIGATAEEIAKALQKRGRWVHEHVAAARKRFEHVLPREYVSGEQVIYLGRRYSLKVKSVPRGQRAVKLKGALLEVSLEVATRDAVRARVRAWFRVKARDYFRDRIAVVAGQLPWPQPAPDFHMKEMSTRWGSCAAGGTITLNPFLVRAPRECIDYVITHELCHLREHNHSPEFFRILTRAMPDWQETKRRLDAMAEVLLND